MKIGRKKRIALLIGVLFCCLAAVPVCAAGEEIEGPVDVWEGAFILQEGGFPVPEEEADGSSEFERRMPVYAAAADSFETRLKTAAGKWAVSFDVTSLRITVDELLNGKLYTKVLNKNPELFYLTGGYSYYYNGNYVTSIILKYDSRYTRADADRFRQVVDGILSGVEAGWGEEQKALYLHDYLVLHCDYDYEKTRWNAYEALVNHSSICQGYTLAYTCLLNRVGIPSTYVSSAGMNHAWNLIEIGGQEYYVDCTWDDQSLWFSGYCAHRNFLRSEQGLVSTGHKSADWVTDRVDSIYGKTGKSTRYDTYYWSGTETAVCMKGSKVYYDGGGEDGSLRQLRCYDYGTKKDAVFCELPNSRSDAWYNRYLFVDLHGDTLVAASAGDIYQIDRKNGAFIRLWTLTDGQAAEGTILDMEVRDGKVYYDLYAGIDAEDYRKTESVPAASSSVPVKSIRFEKDEVSLYSIDTVTLTPKILPADTTAPHLIWESSDPSVASVVDGVVSCHAAGEAVITARAFFGTAKAECRITVEQYRFVNRLETDRYGVHIAAGGTASLSVAAMPEDATDRGVSFTSLDPEVASVDENGVVRGLRQGIARIRAVSDGRTAWGGQAEVTVLVGVVKDGELSGRELLVILPDREAVAGQEVSVDVLWSYPYTVNRKLELKELIYDETVLEFIGFEDLCSDKLAADNGKKTLDCPEAIPLKGGERLFSLRFRALQAGEPAVSVVLKCPGGDPQPETAAATVTVQAYIRGDMNADFAVDSNDAIYLLRHTMNGKRYPLGQPADVNGDGAADSNDAIHLLRHTMNGERYPLAE